MQLAGKRKAGEHLGLARAPKRWQRNHDHHRPPSQLSPRCAPGRDHLLQAALDAAYATPLLTGARQARARELLDQIDTAISHCERLAVDVGGNLRASLAGLVAELGDILAVELQVDMFFGHIKAEWPHLERRIPVNVATGRLQH
jgi:phosphoglycolate phosphatase-like HAD superfamily hydrolase